MKMNTKTIVKNFCEQYFGTTNSTRMAEDFGAKVKVNKDGEVVISRSYFYQVNSNIGITVDDFVKFAASNGVTATATGPITYNAKPWPKTSWSNQTVVIS